MNPVQLASMYTLFYNDGNILNPCLIYNDNNKGAIWKKNVTSKENAHMVLNDLVQVVENINGTGHEVYTKGKKIADIGTDHGYIPVYLLNKGHVDFAILADVNKGPLENARSEVRHNNLTDKVDLRLGSGIEVLNENEVDEVIIAGMGLSLIHISEPTRH